MAAMPASGVTRIDFDGRPAWRKVYGAGGRAWRLRLMDGVAQLIEVPALRPPPHPVGAAACALEAKRLAELSRAGVVVPDILEAGPRHLGRVIHSQAGRAALARVRGQEERGSG